MKNVPRYLFLILMLLFCNRLLRGLGAEGTVALIGTFWLFLLYLLAESWIEFLIKEVRKSKK